ncbi:MAG: hypothetical protein LQ347_001523 [Umbilicaria vellea]|nr:MAG: hypothetical protein LQ347_001523 [Umbilicaria vellea]
MKTSSTLVTGFATVCLAFFAGVSAAPVENAAAAAENTGPKDLHHPHWKKPIPTWSHHIPPPLEVRALEVAGPSPMAGPTPRAGITPTAGTTPTVGTTPTASPTHTAGPPVPGFPTDGQFSWGQGYTLSFLKTQKWWGEDSPPHTTTAYPTILACDGKKHPESYSWEKCSLGISMYYKDEAQKHWDKEVKKDAERVAEAHAMAAKWEADRAAKLEKMREKAAADAKKKAWEHEKKKGKPSEAEEAKEQSKHAGGH